MMQFVLSTALVLIAGLACFLVYFIEFVFFSRGLKLPEYQKIRLKELPHRVLYYLAIRR
jgi:hypothetical protein